MMATDAGRVDALARIALANVGTEYPYHLMHLVRDRDDVREPRHLHPAFFGACDWHSSVHMHWSLARCLRLQPPAATAAAITAHFDSRLTPAAISRECAYLAGAGRGAFERPYGWGWLLKLWTELDALATDLPAAKRWRDALTPLAAQLADRISDWLPRAEFAVRAGTHGNSAFALIHALHYAQRREHTQLAALIAERAQHWFAADHSYPADYEPGGDDFLSGGLCEALLMQRLLSAGAWTHWWSAFAPKSGALARWLTPVPVSDPADPKIVHLHGLNLSRGWCWRQLQPRLPAAQRQQAEQAVAAHLQASLAAATSGDYVGTHWLASFALLALTGDST